MTVRSFRESGGRAMAARGADEHADPMSRLFPLTFLCGVTITITVFAFMELLPPVPDTAAAAIGKTLQAGGVTYTSPGARPLDPRNRVDAGLMKGAPPAGDADRIWFAAFLVATNHGTRPATMPRRIVLRDMSGHTYEPVTLPRTNRYAFRPRTLAPGAQAPAPTSPAGANLAAGGEMLLFHIPRAAYEQGPLEIQVAAHADLRVSDGGGAHLTSRTTAASADR
jgi:hypothetical protein